MPGHTGPVAARIGAPLHCSDRLIRSWATGRQTIPTERLARKLGCPSAGASANRRRTCAVRLMEKRDCSEYSSLSVAGAAAQLLLGARRCRVGLLPGAGGLIDWFGLPQSSYTFGVIRTDHHHRELTIE